MYLLNGCWLINAPVTSRQPHTLVKYRQKKESSTPEQWPLHKGETTGVKNSLHQSNLLTESNNLRSLVHRRRPRRPPFLRVLSEGMGVTSSVGRKRKHHCQAGWEGAQAAWGQWSNRSAVDPTASQASPQYVADGCGAAPQAASSKLLM